MDKFFRLLNWYKDYRLDKIKAQAEADHYQLKLITDAMTENTNVIKSWFSHFTTTEVPSASVTRDEDEYQREQDDLHPSIRESIQNGIKAGAFPDLANFIAGN